MTFAKTNAEPSVIMTATAIEIATVLVAIAVRMGAIAMTTTMHSCIPAFRYLIIPSAALRHSQSLSTAICRIFP